MAYKLSEEEIGNVSGGACGWTTECNVCQERKSGKFYWVDIVDPATGKKNINRKVCKKCCDKNLNNPNWTNFRFYADMDQRNPEKHNP